MKTYRQIPEDAEYRELYDSYRLTVSNLMETDFLYKTALTNGQVYFDNDEVYGYVNNQAAVRGKNIIITKEYIDNFVIRDFIVYCRSINNLLTLNINCNLKDYRDGKPHFLYIVLSNKGKYEVYDDMFQTNEERILFARFIIDTQGNSQQFYMMLPFAGSADYLKGTQYYQVTDGLRVEVINNSSKELTLTDAKIRYSAINFDDNSSPDCLHVEFGGASVPIRYVVWDSTDSIPRVDWKSAEKSVLTLDKVMNYQTGDIDTIPDDKFSVQKLYYDVYEKCIVAMYGNTIYDTCEEAVFGIDSVMDYPRPDGIDYMIPIAAVITQNSNAAFSSENFRVINLDYNEKEVLDSDTFTRQQAAEAIDKARKALDKTGAIETDLNNHVGDRTNPHQVKLNQLYNSSGQQVVIDDEYANYSVSALLAAALRQVDNGYYKKSGGTISGNASISGTLSVTGKTSLSNTEIKGTLSLDGNITPVTNNTYNIGSTTSRLAGIYAASLDVNGNGKISGTLTSGALVPVSNGNYDIGTDAVRYRDIYAKNIKLTGDASVGAKLSVASGVSISNGGINVTGNSLFNNSIVVKENKDSCLIFEDERGNQYSLRVGSEGRIPTQVGFAIY